MFVGRGGSFSSSSSDIEWHRTWAPSQSGQFFCTALEAAPLPSAQADYYSAPRGQMPCLMCTLHCTVVYNWCHMIDFLGGTKLLHEYLYIFIYTYKT